MAQQVWQHRSALWPLLVDLFEILYPAPLFTKFYAFRIKFCVYGLKYFRFFLLLCLYSTRPPVNTIEVSIGTVQWNSTRSPTNFVRHYWYITPSPDNSPNIVLFRLHESIKFNPNVQPIRLPSHGNFSYDGWSSYRLGFVTPGAGLFSAQLTSIHTSILDNGLCSFNGNASDFEICGSDDSEPNESGPIMRVDAFSGITSMLES